MPNTSRPIALLFSAAAIAAVHFLPVNAAFAQDSTAREVVQPLPSPEIQRLNRALLELARRPRRISALLEAGDASLAVDDHDAALGFYGRAADIEPDNPRVKLGLARVYIKSGRPVEAIPLLNAARTGGVPAGEVLSDQALAFDLVGDQDAAQTAYARAIELNPQDDEARRRLALSYAISNNDVGFQSTLAPLIEARDVAAIRARAFGLAILGEQERAEAIVDAVMPRDLATRINPYLAYMPRLTAAQQAAAANLGIFPRAADIGREDPRIARFAQEGAAGALLEPVGEPLGAPIAAEPPVQIASVSREVVQSAPPSVEQAEPVEANTARRTEPASPGFDLARASETETNSGSGAVSGQASSLPDIATTQVVGEQAQQSRGNPATVADAFADLRSGSDGAAMPVAGSSGDAVDLAAIEIPREAPPQAAPEPAEPEHARRIWVQLATGRDVDALRFDWRRFVRRAPELLGAFEPHVTPWGQANRLLAGPVDSRSDARALVNGLASEGLETFTYTSPEGTEIQRLR
ncbi:tetratricopeptide repeat protein [Erythrobacter sp. Alg231-14]|uniref:tetratricopeptide repeat protein n=1 Tax=Erythrobacter sp. Alg231-14 TaxID=1922225 RepID=UPI000D5530E3